MPTKVFSQATMTDLHHRTAERAYFMSRSGIGADDLDRWLTAERRETPAGRQAAAKAAVAVDVAPAPKPKRRAKAGP